MPKSISPEPSVAPDLTPVQQAQVEALDFTLPDYKALSNGEVGGLSAEALEGYFYGERTRYDTAGKKWFFLREYDQNAWRLRVTVSVGPVILAEEAIPLDQIASKAGEERILAMVERLAVVSVTAAKAARRHQKALQTEKAG